MNKLFFIGLLVSILATTTINSQVVLKGVALKNIEFHKKGDTLDLFGYRISPVSAETEQYLIKVTSEHRFVNITKIELLNANLNFWEEVWFYNRGAETVLSGWDINERFDLYEDAKDYYYNAKKNDLLYQDEVLYDYIYQLILKIHPTELIKINPASFGLIIIKSNESNYFSFDNGFIVLTTGLIAQTKNENELLIILAESISRVVLEHNLLNLKQQIKSERNAEIWQIVGTVVSSAAMVNSNYKNGTNYNFFDAYDIGLATHFISGPIMESIGANYSNEQKVNALKVTNKYMDQLNDSETLSDEEYIKRISGVISFSAWQEYNMMNYTYALELINRIHNISLATEKDFLLLSKLYRATSNTKELNLEALKLIQKAREIGLTNLIDLDKEAGILYLRLNDRDNAKECFVRYKNELIGLEKQGFDISDELEFVNQLLYKYNLQD